VKHCIEITYQQNTARPAAMETVRLTVEMDTLDRPQLVVFAQRVREAVVAHVYPGLIQHVRMFPVRDPDQIDPLPPTANPNQGG
jgi:hypothetical protein